MKSFHSNPLVKMKFRRLASTLSSKIRLTNVYLQVLISISVSFFLGSLMFLMKMHYSFAVLSVLKTHIDSSFAQRL